MSDNDGIGRDEFYRRREQRRRRERASKFLLISVWLLLAVFCFACWMSVLAGAHWLMIHVPR